MMSQQIHSITQKYKEKFDSFCKKINLFTSSLNSQFPTMFKAFSTGKGLLIQVQQDLNENKVNQILADIFKVSDLSKFKNLLKSRGFSVKRFKFNPNCPLRSTFVYKHNQPFLSADIVSLLNKHIDFKQMISREQQQANAEKEEDFQNDLPDPKEVEALQEEKIEAMREQKTNQKTRIDQISLQTKMQGQIFRTPEGRTNLDIILADLSNRKSQQCNGGDNKKFLFSAFAEEFCRSYKKNAEQSSRIIEESIAQILVAFKNRQLEEQNDYFLKKMAEVYDRLSENIEGVQFLGGLMKKCEGKGGAGQVNDLDEKQEEMQSMGQEESGV